MWDNDAPGHERRFSMIAVLSSIKDNNGERDSEMHKAKNGN